jgi:hypothetical protein
VGGEPPRYLPSPISPLSRPCISPPALSSRKESGCPGVEVDVDAPATEKDRGGRELETDRAGGVAPHSQDLRRLPKLIRPCAILPRRGSMFAQTCPVLGIVHASANVADSSSSHLQFLSQLLNLSVASTPPFLAEVPQGSLSSRLCRDMGLQDDFLQPQHQLLFRDEDELALRAELPQKGLRLRV